MQMEREVEWSKKNKDDLKKIWEAKKKKINSIFQKWGEEDRIEQTMNRDHRIKYVKSMRIEFLLKKNQYTPLLVIANSKYIRLALEICKP